MLAEAGVLIRIDGNRLDTNRLGYAVPMLVGVAAGIFVAIYLLTR